MTCDRHPQEDVSGALDAFWDLSPDKRAEVARAGRDAFMAGARVFCSLCYSPRDLRRIATGWAVVDGEKKS